MWLPRSASFLSLFWEAKGPVHLMGGFGVARSPAGTDREDPDRPLIIDMRLTAEQVFGWKK
ncbi:MAG: hypothetical protein GDA48_02965 [Hormoscilla sp. GM102CHS1]|nr:hypothetical protein [Hormoscilla sp. GM102CHS1]